MTKKKSGSTYGRIKIAVNDGRLRLHIPPKLSPDGETKFIALGLDDTPANRLSAEVKILEIERDLVESKFDLSLDKYRQSALDTTTKYQTIGQIWVDYLNYKQRGVKESHLNYMARGLGKWIESNPHQALTEAIEFRDYLWEQTTNGMTKRVLTYVNAAAEWAIKHRRINLTASPYAGMAAELPRHDWEIEGNPNALTISEIESVRAAFANHENLRINNYSLFVSFLLLTGCRPGEAIGLRVKDVSKDRSFVHFNGSLVRIRGKAVRTSGSKNNKIRKFPVNAELERLLDEAIRDVNNVEDFVFTSLFGQPIQHGYFNAKIWKPIVTPIIGRDSTPYSCRDSFISHQLAANVPTTNLCAWCDTSIPVIQKRYLDPSLALAAKPIAFE